MSEDPRCCGSGTCIIDSQGQCWCGQRWDGEKMCPAQAASHAAAVLGPAIEPQSPTGAPDRQGSPPQAASGPSSLKR